MFVTLEGGEGSGKTTQGRRVHEALERAGRDAIRTREPGGTPLAESIRELLLDPTREEMDPFAELFLYAAARAEHGRKVIRPALDRGAVVLCDRYSDATVAYQGYGRGLPISAVKEMCRWAEQGLQPQLTVLFDLPVEEGLARAQRRGSLTRFENAPSAFHERVRNGYLALSRESPDRFLVLDGRATEDELTNRILAAIERGTGRR